jgi:hypothetical protein
MARCFFIPYREFVAVGNKKAEADMAGLVRYKGFTSTR